MVDMGIRNHILPRKRYDLGFTIENIVYLELSRRGGKVNIGKYGSTEVDFVTQKEGVLTYYQVTADMTAEETFEREMRPLRSIQDNYEKIVLTLDRFSLGNYDGIKVMNQQIINGNAEGVGNIDQSGNAGVFCAFFNFGQKFTTAIDFRG